MTLRQHWHYYTGNVTLDHPFNALYGLFHILIPIVCLFIFAACMSSVAYYVRSRKMRLEDVRHHLIPTYEYDPGEQEAVLVEEEEVEWDATDEDDKDEDAALKEPLCSSNDSIGLHVKLAMKQD